MSEVIQTILAWSFSRDFATFLQEFKASADLQITRDMYEDALRDLQEEQVVNKLLKERLKTKTK